MSAPKKKGRPAASSETPKIPSDNTAGFEVRIWQGRDGEWYAEMLPREGKPGVIVHDKDRLTVLSKIAKFGIAE